MNNTRKMGTLAVLCILLFLTATFNAVSAVNVDLYENNQEEAVKAPIQSYFVNYYETLKTGEYVDVEHLFAETDEALIPQRILKNKLLLFKEFGKAYTFYNIKLDFQDIDIKKNSARVSVIENAEFQYNTVPSDIVSSVGNIAYTVELKKVNEDWKITSIDSENNIDYISVREQIKTYKDNTNSKQANRSTLESLFDDKDTYTKTLKSALKKELASISTSAETTPTNSNSFTIQSTYGYDANKGIRYARKYALRSELLDSEKIFNDASPDCTNYVSQCIWAAYGGWDENSITNSRNNVHNKVRMTSEWYGAKLGYQNISNAFAGVPYLYNYVTKSKTTGPVGSGYGEAATSSFNYSNAKPGDVVQLYSQSYGNWRHSLYVTLNQIVDSTAPTVLVCAHSGDYRDKDIIEYLNISDFTKARGIRFSSANF